MMRSITHKLTILLVLGLPGCLWESKPEYGVEHSLQLPGQVRQTWAVAPVVNLSGEKEVDPILQADLLYQQLQQVAGLNVIPVNRVTEVYAALGIRQVESEAQAALVCDLLACDALMIGAVSIYDPFEPPKLGAALHLFHKGAYRRPPDVDPRELARQAAPTTLPAGDEPAGFLQVVGMFDAANGSTRAELMRYAQGRSDPTGPYKQRAYMIEMDRYCGFVYHSLIEQLLRKLARRP